MDIAEIQPFVLVGAVLIPMRQGFHAFDAAPALVRFAPISVIAPSRP